MFRQGDTDFFYVRLQSKISDEVKTRILFFHKQEKTPRDIASHSSLLAYGLTEADVIAVIAASGAPVGSPVSSSPAFDKIKIISPAAALAALEKPPVKEARMELKLSMDLKDIADQAKFRAEVGEDIARAAEVRRESVRVDGVRAGSVIVDLAILAEEGGRDAAAVAFGLEAQARDKSSLLLKGKYTAKTDSLGLKLVGFLASAAPIVCRVLLSFLRGNDFDAPLHLAGQAAHRDDRGDGTGHPGASQQGQNPQAGASSMLRHERDRRSAPWRRPCAATARLCRLLKAATAARWLGHPPAISVLERLLRRRSIPNAPTDPVVNSFRQLFDRLSPCAQNFARMHGEGAALFLLPFS